ncbi:twin-arginine translocation signal domain-containing protein [Alteromonas macleodii]|uniref:twin-arginine translocation signal domain-containing protein n=1 Tax=Alteromonas macleodii TaxID=28108 RepID=UPI00313B32BC
MNSRRQFITKAAAGGVVAAIASKTAWAGGGRGHATGCSVSGNLSGNLSNNHDCNSSNIKGLGPSDWKNILKSRRERESYGVSNSKWKQVFGERSPVGGSKDGSNRLKSFLNSDGMLTTNEALIVAYLNVKSGIYPPPNGQSAEAYVQGLYDDVNYGVYGVNSEQRLIEAVEATYSN